MSTSSDVVRDVDGEFDRMIALLEGIAPADRARAVFGEGPGWQLRDMPTHFALWKRISAATMAKILVTGVLPEEGKGRAYIGIDDVTVDELNDRRRLAWRDRPFEECMAELRAAHAVARTLIGQLTPAQLFKPDGDPQLFWWVPNLRHLELHTPHIRAALTDTKEATSA